MNITFLLAGGGSSGGVRVTVQMANYLLERGHRVRIGYRRQAINSPRYLRDMARVAKLRCLGVRHSCWLPHFKGKRQAFTKLENLDFAEGEIVIATGVHTIGELSSLDRNVVKIRYCHGLLEQEPEEKRMLHMWRGSMPTIAVSPALVESLESLSGQSVLGIVPNGISLQEYYVEQIGRDGVGLVFNNAPIKGPEVAVALVRSLRERFNHVPWYIFGASPRPKDLGSCEYVRYPSIERAREIYNRCKIWFVTSLDEGFCLPILEAMACGCAVISSRHTNASALIHDDLNGFTVPPKDIARYVERAETLLLDEGLRARFVEEGFKTVRKFSWEEASELMERTLNQAVVSVGNLENAGV